MLGLLGYHHKPESFRLLLTPNASVVRYSTSDRKAHRIAFLTNDLDKCPPRPLINSRDHLADHETAGNGCHSEVARLQILHRE
jgi:hypothetical protein